MSQSVDYLSQNTSYQEIILKSNFEILTVSETKLDDDFPDNMFKTDGYHPIYKSYRDSGTFIRSDIPSVRYQNYLFRRKWAIISLYRPQRTSIRIFFVRTDRLIRPIINRYDNTLI